MKTPPLRASIITLLATSVALATSFDLWDMLPVEEPEGVALAVENWAIAAFAVIWTALPTKEEPKP